MKLLINHYPSLSISMKQNTLFQNLINLLIQCEGECTSWARHHINVNGMENCVRLFYNCAEKCRDIIVSAVTGEKDFKTCAAACFRCADECEKYNNLLCNSCAAICRKCARACQNMFVLDINSLKLSVN